MFVTAFLMGAIAMFSIVSEAGVALGSTRVPFRVRVSIAALALVLLAAVDLRAIAKSTFCPIGWRRQTPRTLMRRHRLTVVAAAWGFDTGLVVTTFRVAAVSWGALLLAALDLSPRWVGLGYGLGFTAPLLILLLRPRLGRASRELTPTDPGLEAILRLRPLIQGVSAALLISSCVILLGQFVT